MIASMTRLATLLVSAWLCLCLGHGMARAAAPSSPMATVAVLYFDYSGKDEGMAVLRKGLAQMLISDLSALDAVRLVERDRLEEVLQELKLNQSAKIDPASAGKVGKLLGARLLVLGAYFDLMGVLRADARVVEVETGRVLHSVGASGQPGDFLTVEQRLSEELKRALAGMPAPPSPNPVRPSPAPAPAPAPKTTPPAPGAPAPPGPKAQTTMARRARPPARLRTPTALRYSRALDAMDRGDKAGARTELQQVLKEQPDFQLANIDLDRLMR